MKNKRLFLVILSFTILNLNSVQKTRILSLWVVHARCLLAKLVCPENLSKPHKLEKFNHSIEKLDSSLHNPITKYPKADTTGC